MLKEKSVAPAFSAPDQTGKVRSLADNAGLWTVMYFYPKDDTQGCTKEACGFQDKLKKLKDANAVIVGVSADSVESHQKFAKKHRLTFSLLSDEQKSIINAYEAWGPKSFMGKEYEGIYRITYLIDPKGVIAKAYPDVEPEDHAYEILKDIQAMSS